MIALQVLDSAELTEKSLELLSKQNNDVVLILIVVNILISIIIFVTNYYKDFKLKDKDKEVHRFTLLEERRIDVLNKLYIYMNNLLSLQLSKNLNLKTKRQLSEFKEFYTQNGLYISKPIKKILLEFYDYCTEVEINIANKDIKKEDLLLEKFSNEFNNKKCK